MRNYFCGFSAIEEDFTLAENIWLKWQALFFHHSPAGLTTLARTQFPKAWTPGLF